MPRGWPCTTPTAWPQVYVNSRHLSTFYKINIASKAIVWSVGQYGSMRQVDREGRVVGTLFWQAHGLTRVAPDEWLLFDNNFAIGSSGGPARLVRIAVDAAANVARLTWAWTSPAQWLWTRHHGSVYALWNGNLIASFRTHIAEVSADGRVLWTQTRKRKSLVSNQEDTLFAPECAPFLDAVALWVPPQPDAEVAARPRGRPPAQSVTRCVRAAAPPPLRLAIVNVSPQRFVLPATVTAVDCGTMARATYDVALRPDWRPTHFAIPAPKCGWSLVEVEATTAARDRGALRVSLHNDCACANATNGTGTRTATRI